VDDFSSRGYAISIPSLSLCFSMIGFLVAQFREDLYQIYGKYLAHFLFTWNFMGASFLTFNSPFTTTGNGYFAAWATVAVSAMAMGFTADAFKDKVKGLGSLMGLCACSCIMIFADMGYVGSSAPAVTRSASIYAMVISCITIVLVLGILYVTKNAAMNGHSGSGNSNSSGGPDDHIVVNRRMISNTTDGSSRENNQNNLDENEQLKGIDMMKFIVLSVLTVLWLVLACLVTFSGPFVTTGNGYFSAWAGCACVSFATFNAKKEIDFTKKRIMKFMNRTKGYGGRGGAVGGGGGLPGLDDEEEYGEDYEVEGSGNNSSSTGLSANII